MFGQKRKNLLTTLVCCAFVLQFAWFVSTQSTNDNQQRNNSNNSTQNGSQPKNHTIGRPQPESAARLNASALYQLTITKLNGEPLLLGTLRNKCILFVNTASASIAAQANMRWLNELYRRSKNGSYNDRLVIIAVPTDTFAEEPLRESALRSWFELMNAQFIVTRLDDLNQSPLYHLLSGAANNIPVFNNFNKYLVWQNGSRVELFAATAGPEEQWQSQINGKQTLTGRLEQCALQSMLNNTNNNNNNNHERPKRSYNRETNYLLHPAHDWELIQSAANRNNNNDPEENDDLEDFLDEDELHRRKRSPDADTEDNSTTDGPDGCGHSHDHVHECAHGHGHQHEHAHRHRRSANQPEITTTKPTTNKHASSEEFHSGETSEEHKHHHKHNHTAGNHAHA